MSVKVDCYTNRSTATIQVCSHYNTKPFFWHFEIQISKTNTKDYKYGLGVYVVMI